MKQQKASRVTELGHQNFGIALNGVPFDVLTAEYWNRDRSSGWNVEALSGAMNLGLDRNNAHVQPNGAYHYHGIPTGLLEQFPFKDKPAPLGYAADG
ncbi:MAG: YHYH protein, partial [Rhodospirillaceae bacterium]